MLTVQGRGLCSNREYDIWLSKLKTHNQRRSMLFKKHKYHFVPDRFGPSDWDAGCMQKAVAAGGAGWTVNVSWLLSPRKAAVPTCHKSTLNCSLTTFSLFPGCALRPRLPPPPCPKSSWHEKPLMDELVLTNFESTRTLRVWKFSADVTEFMPWGEGARWQKGKNANGSDW